MVWQELRLYFHALWSILTISESDMVMTQQVRGDGFYFVTREEAARTCMPSIPKSHALRVRL